MGAEAIQELLKGISLENEIVQIREDIGTTNSEARLKETFQTSQAHGSIFDIG